MLKRFPCQEILGNNRFLFSIKVAQSFSQAMLSKDLSSTCSFLSTHSGVIPKAGECLGTVELRGKMKGRSLLPCLWWTSRLAKVNYLRDWSLFLGKGAEWLNIRWCRCRVSQPISKWSLSYPEWACDCHLANQLIVGVKLDPGKKQVTDAQDWGRWGQAGWKTNY